MANQMIALQARAPQTDILGGAIQRNAQMINMLSQQAAAQRQAAVAEQGLQIARSKEARDAAMAPAQQGKAEADAAAARMKMLLDFFGLTVEGLKQARGPEDTVKIGDWLKSQFQSPALQQIVDQTLSSMPADPAQWAQWREETRLQSLDTKDLLERQTTQQNLGTSTRLISTPKYGGGAATVVPGSEAAIAQDIKYIKRDDGSVVAMPAKMGGGGGSGGGVRFGQVVGAPKGDESSKLTAQEQTASYNINRVLRGAQIIKQATAGDAGEASANAPSGTEAFLANTPGLGGLAGFARSEKRQIVAAAQRDVLDALLYLATGAAYNKEQLEGQMESYIPAYADKPGTIASKRERLAGLVQDAKSRAGRAWTPEMDAAARTLVVDASAPADAQTSTKKPKAGASSGWGRATVVGD
jgi:hypothetical protein